ncbi:beta family protein [Nocardiopsis suaedae]|uniref:Beta family protein n=1 Tax=Nocardiopsis suaedae TaxID=3018444 RepID=A0ABT4TPM8_9ACTN|nr:beta family protein [Nocardiopsis suaedae]MDA2806638.1 beta family protein [Nocardiopsis suaedae]
MRYQPILKGRKGEIRALKKLSDRQKQEIHPLIELTPSGTKDEVSTGEFGEEVRSLALKGTFAIDASSGGPNALSEIGAGFADGLIPGVGCHPLLVPVIRLTDSVKALQAAGSVDEAHGAGFCLRFPVVDNDAGEEEMGARLPGLLEHVGSGPSDIDLLLDMQAVRSPQRVESAAESGFRLIDRIAEHGWRSITLAAGAFPKNLDDVPLGQASEFTRYDALLWNALMYRTKGADMGYADYGVAHPEHTSGRGIPHPNLRYTHEQSWIAYKRPREVKGIFRSICEDLVASDIWPGPDFSWGDRWIHDCATGRGGTGSPTEWRAVATSHHIATVVDRLTRIGRP